MILKEQLAFHVCRIKFHDPAIILYKRIRQISRAEFFETAAWIASLKQR